MKRRFSYSRKVSGTQFPNSGMRELGVSFVDGVYIFLLPTILNLPAVLGGGGRFLSAAVLWLVILKNLPFAQLGSRSVIDHKAEFRNKFWSVGASILLPMIGFLILQMFAEIRASYSGLASAFGYIGQVFWMATVGLFAYSTIVRVYSINQLNLMIVLLVAGLGFLLALNLMLSAAGISGGVILTADAGQNKMLSAVGIDIQRIRSPLTGGLNNFATASSLALLSGWGVIITRRGFARIVGYVVLFLGLLCVVLADSRAVVLASILAIVIVALVNRISTLRHVLYILVFLLPLLPIVFVIVSPLIKDAGALSWLQRDGSFAAKIGITSGRDVIWKSILDIAWEWNPLQIFGYGSYGQHVSGATKDYSWIFAEIGGMSGKSAHNATLQVFIDMGYAGLAVWLIWISKIIQFLTKSIQFGGGAIVNIPPTVVQPLLLGVVLVVLCGLTEVAGTIYYPDIFCFLIIMTVWIAGAKTFMIMKGEGNVANLS